ncbi:MAG: outer membrane beta-barrel protein [Tatlockia sp.]|nr:outer membrane beta-barrel protein [Tatlockia sp.]
MKKLNTLTLASLLFANCSAFSATPAEGWYAGITGGISLLNSLQLRPLGTGEIFHLNGAVELAERNYRHNISLSSPLNPILSQPFLGPRFSPVGGSIRHSFGGNFAGQVGYRICNYRFEGELLLNYAPISKLDIGGVRISKDFGDNGFVKFSGKTLLGAGLFNFYYDFFDEEEDPTWVPYLGLGIGLSHISNSAKVTVGTPPLPPCVNPFIALCLIQPAAFTLNLDSSTSAPVGQGIIGVHYYTSDNFAIGLDYRYLSTNTIKTLNSRISINSINLNLNYWFND